MSVLSQQVFDGNKQEQSSFVGGLWKPDFLDTTFRNRKLNDAEFSLKITEKWVKLNNTIVWTISVRVFGVDLEFCPRTVG